MELNLNYQEKDLLIDCIQHRLDTDKILVINDSLKKHCLRVLTNNKNKQVRMP